MSRRLSDLPIDEQLRTYAAIRRGDVVIVDMSADASGRETGKQRPCVVLSNDVLNIGGNTLVVVPLSTHGGTGKMHKHDVKLERGDGGLTEAGVAIPLQVRTIDKRSRVVDVRGRLSDAAMRAIFIKLLWVMSDEPVEKS